MERKTETDGTRITHYVDPDERHATACGQYVSTWDYAGNPRVRATVPTSERATCTACASVREVVQEREDELGTEDHT